MTRYRADFDVGSLVRRFTGPKVHWAGNRTQKRAIVLLDVPLV